MTHTKTYLRLFVKTSNTNQVIIQKTEQYFLVNNQ